MTLFSPLSNMLKDTKALHTESFSDYKIDCVGLPVNITLDSLDLHPVSYLKISN